MIKDDDELQKVIERVGSDLNDVQRYLGRDDHPSAKIKFPRGYLREAVGFRREIWFVDDEVLRRNLAYAHILSDIYRWLINRTDLTGVAEGMIIKEGICLVGSICESLTKEVAVNEGIVSKKLPYKARCKAMSKTGMISDGLCEELCWVWDVRQNEHIFLVDEREHEMYTLGDYNRAIKGLRALKGELNAYFGV